jgi:hypothetical protein
MSHVVPVLLGHAKEVGKRLKWTCYQEEEEEEEERVEKDKAACRTRSLSSEFKQYLAQQGLQVPSDSSSLEVTRFIILCAFIPHWFVNL